LIFLNCSTAAIIENKQIFELFEQATGLSINYHKTTLLPIAIPPETAQELAITFGTTVSSFPPKHISAFLCPPNKISATNYLPLISSCDKYISGWRASLLNRAGRLTLSTAVLSSISLHYMSSMSVPKTIIKAIDRRRCVFFWTGDDVCHGSKCLVAWENVRASKEDGGLDMKDLELQNRCLLMKFIDKLFSNDSVAWKDWLLRDAASFDIPSTRVHSYLWKIITDELNTFQSITFVNVLNGASAFF
jgi:hypothetical protein